MTQSTTLLDLKECPWIFVAISQARIFQHPRSLPGLGLEPRILGYLKTVREFHQVNWCSGFVNWCLSKAGIPGTNNPGAESWLCWGQNLSSYKFGSVIVWQWSKEVPGKQLETGQHVAFCVGKEGRMIKMLGGNQRKEVSIHHWQQDGSQGLLDNHQKVGKFTTRVVGYRWPLHKSALSEDRLLEYSKSAY
jgi:uncharacterized protein (TIGR02594 family)